MTRSEYGKKICRFIRERYEPWRGASLSAMREYVYWFWARHLLAVVQDHGRLLCAVTFRMFNDPEDFLHDFRHDPSGRIVAFEVAVGEACYLQDALASGLQWHGGPRDYVMWNRFKT